MVSVDEALRVFRPEVLSVRLVAAVLEQVPGAPAYVHYDSVAGAVRALDPSAGPEQVAAAEARAQDSSLGRLIWMGRRIDATDRARPFRFEGEHERGPQADDAVLKALSLGWFASRCGGAPAFARIPAGQAMIAWWAAIEIVLPLGATEPGALLAERGVAQLSRLAALVGEQELVQVMPTTQALIPALAEAVSGAAAHAEALVQASAPFVPGLLASPKGADEAVAARADRMPVFNLLAARLAAELAAGG
ncbi:MAG TPA: hypothetical protein ENK18_23710 [Deltaproteobacteria bacterium]|nr:hypothetical protein [Deltaproteobacteria bacterium]